METIGLRIYYSILHALTLRVFPHYRLLGKLKLIRTQVLHLRFSSAPSIIVNVVNSIVYAMDTVITVITIEIQTDLANNVKINNESGT